MSLPTGAITAPLGRLRRAGKGRPDRRRLLLLALAVVLAVAAGYALYRRATGGAGTNAPEYTEAPVTRGPILSSVSASGSVSASRNVKLSFATGGRLNSVAVKQGDTVQQGQEIATLDTAALEIKRD